MWRNILKDKRNVKDHVWVGLHFSHMISMFHVLLKLGILKEEKLSVVRSGAGVYARYE